MSKSIRERFPPPWKVEHESWGYRIVSSNDAVMARVYVWDDFKRNGLRGLHGTVGYVEPEEGLAIANAIAALPDLVAQREADAVGIS